MRWVLGFAVPGFVVLAGFAQQPQITNGTLVPAASASIEREIEGAARGSEPSWVAWQVPAVDGRSRNCCWYSSGGTESYGCSIEPEREFTPPARPTGPVPIEPSDRVLVMARVVPGSANGGDPVERVRTFSGDCPLDAGGRTIRMIDGVTPEASVRWLAARIEARAQATRDGDRANSELAAIAATAGPAADEALERFIGRSQPSKLRQQAVFWIGQSRGETGFRTLEAMFPKEADERVRKSVIQAFSRSKHADAIPTLVSIAKTDADADMRGEALFWLAQTAGKSVAAEITDAAANDPDAKVQERAVMALSQLPKDEGVPLLIDLARTHKNMRVRKRAMFWLGQSKDPRAVRFFEEILIGR